MLVVMKPFSLLSSTNPSVPFKGFRPPICSSLSRFQLCKNPNRALLRKQNLMFCWNYSIWRGTHVSFCYAEDISEDLVNNQPPDNSQNVELNDSEELELLDKPLPIAVNGASDTKLENEPKKLDKDEALEPFLKFFKSKESVEELAEQDEGGREVDTQKMVVEYYEPKTGDFVVGVVVSGNENKLDVNVGADMLGTMLTKEILPLYDKEMDYLSCDLDKNVDEFMANGKIGIVHNEDAIKGKPISGRPVVDAGTVLFAEVLGRTLSGRPLLSTRRFFKRIAWHRVRQIQHLGEPIEVRITEWNTGGLLTRIEGLRAFLPKAELVDRVNTYTDLKSKVGRRIYVQINRINEENNDLILSEREAWEKLYLREGALLEGTIKKIYPYGAQVKIGESNRSGLLHASNISRVKFDSISDLLAVGEKVKVLVIRSLFPDKISLSIAELESEPGLFISDKQKVFAEAEEMAKKYRLKLPRISATHMSEPPISDLLFEDEASLYANWKWFKFQRENEPDSQ
ncbi:protein PIGMENT DEFECTIVE 338, chloroplastic [Amaranthus tricolor]|uniref:protein PIGMENT DEFECTIVE 338, chloroplastic n=1 Tax=Amaranthus tricolor TaxID=29722 RepID=UPI002585355B|nr:protein PIGMENT DEFECTIVE 338, chloroplastic [Amaranthus tricolor]